MSSQKDGMIQMTQSYNFNSGTTNNFRGRTIEANNFHAWTKDNMYKSSYAKFHSSKSVQPKNSAIPGYMGFIPGIKAQNLNSKSFASITKESFKNQNLGKNQYGLSTTGFNINKNVFIDNSKLASSSKYGKSEIQKPHPNWNISSWCSTTKDAFQNPNLRVNPTYRPTDKFVQNKKQNTKSSGFALNYSLCDGKGWKPHESLNGDLNRSQYRDRYNNQKPFQRNTFLDKIRKIQAKQKNYKLN